MDNIEFTNRPHTKVVGILLPVSYFTYYVADAPGALFTEEFLAKRVDQDMQVKMREDPLFMIR